MLLISYSQKDAEKARSLCEALESRGVKCWVAFRDISPGTDWTDAISEAIETCDSMIVLFSKLIIDSKNSYTKNELLLAKKCKKNIIPVFLEEFELPNNISLIMGPIHYESSNIGIGDETISRIIRFVEPRAEIPKTTVEDEKDVSRNAVKDKKQTDPENWNAIKKKIINYIKNVFDGIYPVTLDEAADLFKEVIEYDIKDKDLDGLQSLINSFDKFFNYIDPDDKIMPLIHLGMSVEPFLKKIYKLTKDREFSDRGSEAKPSGLKTIMGKLKLIPQSILDAGTAEAAKEETEKERKKINIYKHIIEICIDRNDFAHRAKEFDSSQIATAFQSVVITYFFVVFEKFGNLIAALPFRDLNQYVQKIIYDFRGWEEKFTHIDGVEKSFEEINSFDPYLSETGFENEVNESQTEASEERRHGRISDIRKDIRHMVILGPPGMGKSTTMQYLAYKDALEIQKRTVSENIKYPVYIELKYFDENNGIIQIIDDTVKLGREKLTQILENGNLTLFLDGLNEVGDKYKGEVRKQIINEILRKYPENTVIISSRPQAYNNEFKIPAFNLQLMDEEKIKEFIVKNYTDGETRDKFVNDLSANSRLFKLCQVPLTCNMLIKTVQKMKGCIPENKGLLIRYFTSQLFAIDREKSALKESGIDLMTQAAVLSYLAFNTRMAGSVGFTESRASEQINKKLEFFHKKDIDIIEFVDKMIDLNMLERKLTGHLSFTHEIYQEYYAAEELYNLEEEGERIIKEKGNDPFWEQPIILYTGLSRNRERSVMAISSDNTLLAARAITSSTKEEPELTRQIMAKAETLAKDLSKPKNAGQGILTLLELDKIDKINEIILMISNPGKNERMIAREIIMNATVDQALKFVGVISRHKHSVTLWAFEFLSKRYFDNYPPHLNGEIKKLLNDLLEFNSNLYNKSAACLLLAFRVKNLDHKIFEKVVRLNFAKNFKITIKLIRQYEYTDYFYNDIKEKFVSLLDNKKFDDASFIASHSGLKADFKEILLDFYKKIIEKDDFDSFKKFLNIISALKFKNAITESDELKQLTINYYKDIVADKSIDFNKSKDMYNILCDFKINGDAINISKTLIDKILADSVVKDFENFHDKIDGYNKNESKLYFAVSIIEKEHLEEEYKNIMNKIITDLLNNFFIKKAVYLIDKFSLYDHFREIIQKAFAEMLNNITVYYSEIAYLAEKYNLKEIFKNRMAVLSELFFETYLDIIGNREDLNATIIKLSKFYNGNIMEEFENSKNNTDLIREKDFNIDLFIDGILFEPISEIGYPSRFDQYLYYFKGTFCNKYFNLIKLFGLEDFFIQKFKILIDKLFEIERVSTLASIIKHFNLYERLKPEIDLHISKLIDDKQLKQLICLESYLHENSNFKLPDKIKPLLLIEKLNENNHYWGYIEEKIAVEEYNTIEFEDYFKSTIHNCYTQIQSVISKLSEVETSWFLINMLGIYNEFFEKYFYRAFEDFWSFERNHRFYSRISFTNLLNGFISKAVEPSINQVNTIDNMIIVLADLKNTYSKEIKSSITAYLESDLSLHQFYGFLLVDKFGLETDYKNEITDYAAWLLEEVERPHENKPFWLKFLMACFYIKKYNIILKFKSPLINMLNSTLKKITLYGLIDFVKIIESLDLKDNFKDAIEKFINTNKPEILEKIYSEQESYAIRLIEIIKIIGLEKKFHPLFKNIVSELIIEKNLVKHASEIRKAFQLDNAELTDVFNFIENLINNSYLDKALYIIDTIDFDTRQFKSSIAGQIKKLKEKGDSTANKLVLKLEKKFDISPQNS